MNFVDRYRRAHVGPGPWPVRLAWWLSSLHGFWYEWRWRAAVRALQRAGGTAVALPEQEAWPGERFVFKILADGDVGVYGGPEYCGHPTVGLREGERLLRRARRMHSPPGARGKYECWWTRAGWWLEVWWRRLRRRPMPLHYWRRRWSGGRAP